MAEYIEREELMKYADTQPGGLISNKSIQFFQAADVAPVVHGEWVLHHVGAGHYWECSACHKNPCIYVTKDTKFCPNCGARMDKEDT